MKTKSIQINYFALLKEKVGFASESLTVNLSSYHDLYEFLSTKYSFGLPSSMVQVAVNDEFCSMRDPIADGAKVVFIPPVAGG